MGHATSVSLVCKCGGLMIDCHTERVCDCGKNPLNCLRCSNCRKYLCPDCMEKQRAYSHWFKFDICNPFGQGMCRYAYHGVDYLYGRQQKVVLKKFINKTSYNESDWKGDLKCYKTAMEFIKAWNKLGLTNKQYVMYEPTIFPMTNNYADIADTEEKEKMINDEEYVMVERYLEGKYEKWNSNSGWFLNKQMSIQAFCHWTYHYSKGKLLMCDAQGVRGQEAYYITDPAIISEISGQYGCTDMGKEGMQQWFAYHQCNEFCGKNWLKPANKKYKSFSVQKCSTYRWKTGNK
eukprot:81435_1